MPDDQHTYRPPCTLPLVVRAGLHCVLQWQNISHAAQHTCTVAWPAMVQLSVVIRCMLQSLQSACTEAMSNPRCMPCCQHVQQAQVPYSCVCLRFAAEAVNMLAALKMPGLNDRPPSATVALALANLAAAVKEHCRYPLAKQLLQHALAMAEAADATDDPFRYCLCAIRNNLATVLRAQGELRQAELLSRSAFDSKPFRKWLDVL